MLVSDLVYADGVDIECNFKIYDVTKEAEGTLLVDTAENWFRRIPCNILDMRVVSISAKEGELIIKARTNAD